MYHTLIILFIGECIVTKHVFIINPAAGKSRGMDLIPEIKKIFQDSPNEYIIEITNAPGHAEILAASYSRQSKCRIYSVGGDGTLNEIMNGMAGTDSELAIIPCGSGNDFIRSITDNLNINDLLLKTVSSKAESIDFAKVNSRYFLNIASVGFDAEVVYNARKFKKVPGISGSLAYMLSIIYTVFVFKGRHLEITVDSHKISGKFLLAAVANGKFYGGGMKPVPHADLRDGMLDICLIDALNIFKILAFFPKFMKGDHVSMKEAHFLKGRLVDIECFGRDISINADGEIFRGRKIQFEMQSKTLSVVIPEKEAAMLGAAEVK